MSGIGTRRMRWSGPDFHILWQVKEGKSPREVAELLG